MSREALLQSLAPEARASLTVSLDQLEALAVRALHEPLPPIDAERVAACSAAHSVAGTAGTFGWHLATAAGREAEALLSGQGPLELAAAVRLAELVMAARDDLVSVSGAPEAGSLPAQRGLPPLPAADAAVVDLVVVDDDPVLRRLIEQVAAANGWSTLSCVDGVEALEVLGGDEPPVRPRVVVLDIDLPGRSGLSVLRELQAAGTTQRTRVMMLSSRSGGEDQAMAAGLGAQDFLAKPFDLAVLQDRVKVLLGSDLPV